jgi:hypothetical protein
MSSLQQNWRRGQNRDWGGRNGWRRGQGAGGINGPNNVYMYEFKKRVMSYQTRERHRGIITVHKK